MRVVFGEDCSVSLEFAEKAMPRRENETRHQGWWETEGEQYKGDKKNESQRCCKKRSAIHL